jgi:hypothetical protein
MRNPSPGRRMLAAITALLCAALPAAAPAAGPDAFVGTWVRVEREQDDAARDAVIVRATEPMSFAFRGFARRVMRKQMVPTERYVVEQVAGVAQIRNDKGVVVPLDGRPHVFDSQREVTSRFTETGWIEQTWKEGPDRYGVTTWKLEPDGRLVISQRVVDPHFTVPLEFATTYRRDS